MAVDSLALKVTVEGGMPLRTLPVWVTFTFTFSAAVGAGSAVSVNVAAMPSVTLARFAVIVISGGSGAFISGASLSSTVTDAEDGELTV